MCFSLGCCEYIFRVGSATKASSPGGPLLMNDGYTRALAAALGLCLAPSARPLQPEPVFPRAGLGLRAPEAAGEPVPRKLCSRDFGRSFLTRRADFVSSAHGITKMLKGTWTNLQREMNTLNTHVLQSCSHGKARLYLINVGLRCFRGKWKTQL